MSCDVDCPVGFAAVLLGIIANGGLECKPTHPYEVTSGRQAAANTVRLVRLRNVGGREAPEESEAEARWRGEHYGEGAARCALDDRMPSYV